MSRVSAWGVKFERYGHRVRTYGLCICGFLIVRVSIIDFEQNRPHKVSASWLVWSCAQNAVQGANHLESAVA